MNQTKKNLINYPLGTVGRDMIYVLFNNFLYLYILYTRNLTVAQLSAITGIMVAARIFDALNDPIMGNIIERTRSKHGKFKPWLVAGILSTSVVVYLAFNTNLEGWNFIWFFGIIYFMYSITYTMNDISYWGMIPALADTGDARNTFTSRATLFAGIGNVLATVLIPLLTTGSMAIGGNARTAFGVIAAAIVCLAMAFSLFTIFGVKENREDMKTAAPRVSFKKIISTICGNDQLLWISLIFLLQEIGNNIAIAGVGSNYIYFEFGYEGGLYSLFTTVGMAVTAILMIIYPMISRKWTRNQLVMFMMWAGIVGYIIQLCAGLFMPSTMAKFWVITIGFMFANFGQYGLYLVMMISIINTVEYNEYKKGTRDEAIITSMRPFLTKLSSSIVVIITTITYIICKVTNITNQISDLERQSQQGLVTAEEKSQLISGVIATTTKSQNVGLLIAMTVIPCAFMVVCCILYVKKYKLTEKEFDRICEELKSRK